MKEILIYKCKNGIVANRIVNVLDANSIAYRQHDETVDKRPGAYGPIPGISIYVFEKDYNRAMELIDPIIKDNIDGPKPMCPKCGSEEVEALPRGKYSTGLMLLSIILFLIPALWFAYPKETPTNSLLAQIVGVMMILGGILLMFISRHKSLNHKCNSCGRKFNHI